MATDVPDYSGYQRLPSWILGFHGCDESTAREVLQTTSKHLKPSDNKWDWLGTGIYFWENDPLRARQFAEEGVAGKVTRGKIKKPFVIGAIIDLGLCFNLFDQAALKEMQQAAHDLMAIYDDFRTPLPQNKGSGPFLDRAVFEHMHSTRSAVGELPDYQTVRASFPEGEALYPGAGFTEQNHIQIAVRDQRCIKGYFLPRDPC